MPAVILIVIAVVVSVVAYSYSSNSAPPATSTPPLIPNSSSPSPAPVPESSPTPAPSLHPTSPPPTSGLPPPVSSERFVYPGASSVSSGVYTSGDNPDNITDWYKQQITSSGYNVRSFVKTKTNGQVSNKLVASGHSSSISVEVTKSPDSSITHITVVLDNP